MKDVIIEMRDGVVQDVYTDEKVRVVIVNWDEFQDSTESCVGKFNPFPLSAMPVETEAQVWRLK